MNDFLSILRGVGTDTRSSACSLDHPILQGPHTATINELSTFFLTEGVELAVAAAQKAISEWGGSAHDITHMVSTTCTHSGNPGFDLNVARTLGLRASTQRTLLHGVGCSGGLAALRTAATTALAATHLGQPARILVVACELPMTTLRAQLDRLHATQVVNAGMAIFGDGASALVLSNGLGGDPVGCATAVYDLLGWDHLTLPDTADAIRFDVEPKGESPSLRPRSRPTPIIATAAH